MAGDWIKLRIGIGDEPEVIGMARRLKVDRDTVVGKLARVWAWVSQISRDGVLYHVTLTDVDDIARCASFADSMLHVGWLELHQNDALLIPRFERHNGESAKNRADWADRKRRSRHANVTEMSRNCPAKSVTREEKRRVLTPIPPDGGGADAHFDAFWKSYPRKVGKLAARKSWDRAKPDAAARDLIAAAIARQRSSAQWQKENGRFIPNPATWLNQGRWLDEVESVDAHSDARKAATARVIAATSATPEEIAAGRQRLLESRRKGITPNPTESVE